MADIEDLNERINRLKQSIYDALPDIATKVTVSAKALAERNVRNDGFGADYSNNTIPAFFLKGKAKSNAGEKFIEDAEKADEEINWKELRMAEGLPVDKVNLSFTNKMWAGMGPQKPYWAAGLIYCPLGGNNQEVVNKMNWNRDRYGDWIGKVLQNKEIKVLQQIVVTDVTDLLKQSGIIQ